MMLCAEEGNAIVDALETTYRVLFNICTSFCSLYLSKILSTNNSGLLSWKQMRWEMAWRLSSASTRRVQGWKAHILAFLHSKCLHRLINISSFRWKMRVDCWIVLKNTWVHIVHSNCILKYLQERRNEKRSIIFFFPQVISQSKSRRMWQQFEVVERCRQEVKIWISSLFS